MEIAYTFNYRSGNILLQRHITTCEVEKIKNLFNDGHGLSSISRELKIGSTMVSKILVKLNFKRDRIEALKLKTKAKPLEKTGRFANLK